MASPHFLIVDVKLYFLWIYTGLAITLSNQGLPGFRRLDFLITDARNLNKVFLH